MARRKIFIPENLRLATIKTTGRRFIVLRIDFRERIVFTYGRVTGFVYNEGAKTAGLQVEEKGLKLKLDEVTISEAWKSPTLAAELAEQTRDDEADKGYYWDREVSGGQRTRSTYWIRREATSEQALNHAARMESMGHTDSAKLWMRIAEGAANAGR